MDDKDQSFWRELQVYEELTKDILGSTISDTVKEMNGEENPLLEEVNCILGKRIIRETRPLTYALATLETYEKTLWNEKKKKKIVSYLKIIEDHCEDPNLRRHLPPPMLNFTYESVCKYGERLAEFNADQQKQITKVIDSLRKYVV